MEPDLVIPYCPCWLELQHADDASPMGKLEQAERDVKETGSDLWPVSIVRTTAAKRITVTMRMWTLTELLGAPEPQQLDIHAMPVQVDFGDFKILLEQWGRK